MDKWISKIKKYLRHFVELGLLLLTVSVFAEILFALTISSSCEIQIQQQILILVLQHLRHQCYLTM